MGNKYKIWLLKGLACIAAVSFAGCTDTLYDDSEGHVQDNAPSEPSYFAIKIYDTSSFSSPYSRAGESDRFDSDYPDFGTEEYIFNKGLEAEKAIYTDTDETAMPSDHHFALFFDNLGKKKRSILLRSTTKVKEATGNDALVDKDGNELDKWDAYTLLYSGPVEDDLLERQENGTMLVIVNASDALIRAFANCQTLDEFKELKGNVEDFLYFTDSDGKRYFTMSSSMVIKNGIVMPASNGKLIFYTTQEEAQANETDYQMFVERLQSKYTVLFKSGDKHYYLDKTAQTETADLEYNPKKNNVVFSSQSDFNPTEKNLSYVTDYSRNNSINDRDNSLTIKTAPWKINFTGWGLNALESEEYLVKKLDGSKNYFTNWNNSTFSAYRNFWAEDATYISGTYPDQYREATDDEDIMSAGDIGPHSLKSSLSLKYYSWEDLNNKDIHQYSPESTFDQSIILDSYDSYENAINDLAHMRAGTHLVITAQLLIDGWDDSDGIVEANGLIQGVSDKFYMNGIYWSEQAYKEYVAEYLGYWMLTSENQATTKFGPNDGNFYVKDGSDYKPAAAGDFQVVPANIKGGDGMVWLKPGTNKILYVKDPSKEDASAYQVLPSDLYEALAKEHTEYFAKHYTEGRMYYAVPVRHNVKSSLSGTGDFGSVRNHWYYFDVTEILTPGAPVDDPDQPIVPNKEPVTNGLGVNIKILDWNIISTNVDGIFDQHHAADKKD